MADKEDDGMNATPVKDRRIGRRKSRLACESCRQRKRKCDGRHPCYSCLRYEHACSYSERPKEKAQPFKSAKTAPEERNHVDVSLQLGPSDDDEDLGQGLKAMSRQAFSGHLFAQHLQYSLSDGDSSQLRNDSWNLGVRQRPPARPKSILGIISREEVLRLHGVYLETVHPVYSLVNGNVFVAKVNERWSGTRSSSYDAIICGVGALGSLFLGDTPSLTEAALVEYAKHMLEIKMATPQTDVCFLTVGVAWLLRTLYLHMADDSHASWIASCSTIRAVESVSSQPCRTEGYTDTAAQFDHAKLHWLARMLNEWISNACCRPYAGKRFHKMTCLAPALSLDIGDVAPRLIALYKLSRTISGFSRPEQAPELEDLLLQIKVLGLGENDVLTLHKANHAFCIYRRLRTLTPNVSQQTLSHIIVFGHEGLQASLRLAQSRQPWWHIANVPFQFLCVMLAIDVRSSLSEIDGIMQTLWSIAEYFNTEQMHKIIETAESLIRMCRNKKSAEASMLGQQTASTHPEALGKAKASLFQHDQLPANHWEHFQWDAWFESELSAESALGSSGLG